MKITKIEETFPNPARGVDYAVHFVRLDDGERAVWKPNMAAVPTAVVPLKERAAYEIDGILGTNLVSETEIYCHEGKWGVLQRFVENAIDGHQSLRENKPYLFGWMQRLGIFDFICSNPDRGPSNWLLKPDGSLVAIDNGGCFQERDTFTWSMPLLIGREITDGNKEFVKVAYSKMQDICRTIFDVQYAPTGGAIKGSNVFGIAAELAVNHIHVLAAAIGLTNDRYHVLGLVNCGMIGIDREQA